MDKEKMKLIEQHIDNIEHINALTWEEKVLWYFNSLGTYKQETDKDITILSDVRKQLTKEKILQINSKLEKKYHIK
jgi:adenine deaminase